MSDSYQAVYAAVRNAAIEEAAAIWDSNGKETWIGKAIRALKSSAPVAPGQAPQPEPVAWRYQRDTQSHPGKPNGTWEFMAHGNSALDLQGKRLGWKPNGSYLCWEPLYTAPIPAPAQQPANLAAPIVQDIRTWQQRLNVPASHKAQTGEEAAMCMEIADLRAALAAKVSQPSYDHSKPKKE